MAIKDILKEELEFRITGTLRIENQNGRFFGPGRLELLENIILTGSISKAAKNMNMSYKKAWEMVTSMNQQSKIALVSTQVGGEKGGGTIITKAGMQLMASFQKLNEECQLVFKQKMAEFLSAS